MNNHVLADIEHCSFCFKSIADVEQLIRGPGVGMCNECVDASRVILMARRSGAAHRERSPDEPRSPDLVDWRVLSDDELLEFLPHLVRAAGNVEATLRSWVNELRERKVSWTRIGKALGMTRQSAWERFAETGSTRPGRQANGN